MRKIVREIVQLGRLRRKGQWKWTMGTEGEFSFLTTELEVNAP